MKATKPQIQKIHILLSNLGMIDSKKYIVYELTDGRTQSTKELTIEEARGLITTLLQHDPAEKQKSLIFSLAYKAGIIYGDTAEDKKINAAKLTLFLKERGAVKKPLNDMTYTELVKVHRQFEGMVRNVNKSSDKKQADKAVKDLLDELTLIVQ